MSFFGEPSLFIQDWQKPLASQNQPATNQRLILDEPFSTLGMPSSTNTINLGPVTTVPRPRPQSFSELPADTREILSHLFQADSQGNGNGQTSRAELKNYTAGLNQQYETLDAFSTLFGSFGKTLFQPWLNAMDGYRKTAQLVDDAFLLLDNTPNARDGAQAAISRADILAVAARDGDSSKISMQDLGRGGIPPRPVPGPITTLALGEEGGRGFPFPPVELIPHSGAGSTLLAPIRGDLLFDFAP
jgi:hypothetical protein